MVGIKNFLEASDNIATGGQPTAEQLEEIKIRGYQVVINLGLLDTPYALADEEKMVRRLGMQYYHIPVHFDAPSRGNLDDFFSVIDAHSSSRIFVHCAVNHRVSSFVSLYGQAKNDWSEEEANEFIAKVWNPNQVWSNFIEESRRRMKSIG